MTNISKTKGSVVLTAATAISFVSGILYIWSIVSKAIIKEFHWTSTQASLPYTVATVAFSLAMVFAGRLQDVKGPRFCGTIGGILLGLGLILSGFAKDPFVMVITFGIITGVGIGINNVSTTPPAVKWFPAEKKGMISGTVVAGIGLASIMYSPLINYLINEFGISKAFVFLGIGALVSAVIIAQFLENPPVGFNPNSHSQTEKKTDKAAVQVKDMCWQEMVKTADFYKLWTMLAFSSSAGLMIIGHIAKIAVKQAQWENGYLLVVLLAVFNTLGRFLGGTLSDMIGRINSMRIVFFIQAINMLFFNQYTSTTMLAIGVAIGGFCYGATFAVFPATTADFYGMKNLGANYGMVFTAWGLGGVIGPLTAARIFDITGSYHSAYAISMVLLLIAGVITFSFKKIPKQS